MGSRRSPSIITLWEKMMAGIVKARGVTSKRVSSAVTWVTALGAAAVPMGSCVSNSGFKKETIIVKGARDMSGCVLSSRSYSKRPISYADWATHFLSAIWFVIDETFETSCKLGRPGNIVVKQNQR